MMNIFTTNIIIFIVLQNWFVFYSTITTNHTENGSFIPRMAAKDCAEVEDRGCIELPEKENDNRIIATYQVEQSKNVHFTISGKVDPGEYLALALSEDDEMGHDGVIVCYKQGNGIFDSERSDTGILVAWNPVQEASRVLNDTDMYVTVQVGLKM